MTLHLEPELFSELITVTSQRLEIPEVYIEKDYWVCVILKSLSELEKEKRSKVVFKGGTSLSKAHKLIERFSEDIDLAVISEGLSGNQAKAFIKAIEKALVAEVFEEVTDHPQTSKGSKFRKSVHQYPKVKTGDFGDATDVIILELNTFANPTPNLLISVNSYIYDFLIAEKAHDVVSKHSLDPFEINVLAIERTFCEKISAIARASHEGISELQKKIRHLYDIHLLFENPLMEKFFESSAFDDMMAVVKNDDLGNSQFNPEWASRPIKDAPIFKDTISTLAKVKSYYEGTFRSLVHGNLPPITNIQKTIQQIKERLGESNE